MSLLYTIVLYTLAITGLLFLISVLYWYLKVQDNEEYNLKVFSKTIKSCNTFSNARDVAIAMLDSYKDLKKTKEDLLEKYGDSNKDLQKVLNVINEELDSLIKTTKVFRTQGGDYIYRRNTREKLDNIKKKIDNLVSEFEENYLKKKI